MEHKTITAGIIVSILLVAVLPIIAMEEPYTAISGSVIAEPSQQTSARNVLLSFKDTNTNCSLSGDLYLNNQLYGAVEEGEIAVTELPSNSLIAITGKTSPCFGKDSNMSFFQSWTLTNGDYYYFVNTSVPFHSYVSPRQPPTLTAMQQFVRPDEARPALSRINLNGNNPMVENLDRIAQFPLAYISDSSLFKRRDYWQTPRETLMHKEGDCEDWATTILSLMRAYYPSVECYDALWSTHVSVFCSVDNSFIMYDQEHTRQTVSFIPNPTHDELITQENRREARAFLNNYFNEFGIRSDERALQALYNDKSIKTFDSTESFITWMLNESNAL